MNEKKEKYEIENEFEDEIDTEGSENEQNIVILSEEAGSRIDKFLSERLELTRTRIQQLIKDENILVNGKKTKPAYKIEENDMVKVVIPELETVEIKPENIDIEIIYEDNDLAVINKRAGIVVHPANGHYSGTLVNAILYHIKDLSGINGEIRPGIVHRLDKDTSGLLVVAKTPEAKRKLGLQFFNKTTHRSYNALVWANFAENEGRIEGNIGRDPRDRLRMAVFPPDSEMGKPAVTHYRVLERFGYVTFVECILETGRTHQIRAHMKHIGHPMFGDERYGGTEILRGERSSTYKAYIQNCFKLCPRQALHARTLGFVHPTTGQQMDFTSPMPQDMEQLLDKWRNYIKGLAV